MIFIQKKCECSLWKLGQFEVISCNDAGEYLRIGFTCVHSHYSHLIDAGNDPELRWPLICGCFPECPSFNSHKIDKYPIFL